MKKFLSDPKPVFTYLMVASVLAIAGGIYLGVTLGMTYGLVPALLASAGILLWAWAWGEFMAMCLRLRKGESAFTEATGRTLRVIGICMVCLAAIPLLHVWLSVEASAALTLLFLTVLAFPMTLIFLGAALAAKILLGLLEHAMALEEEQEGVV